MLKKVLLWLDDKQWPQRWVRWSLRKRSRPQLAQYLLPSSAGSHAVTLTVATPLLSAKELFEGVVPSQFGSWREFKVRRTSRHGTIAVALLEDPHRNVEFALIVPIHADFDHLRFRFVKRVRLTCEAERSKLVTVRNVSGNLLAAGTLEFTPRAAFSEELIA